MLQSGSPLVAARRQPGGRPPAGDGDVHQPGLLIGGESGGGGGSPGEVAASGAGGTALYCTELSGLHLS